LRPMSGNGGAGVPRGVRWRRGVKGPGLWLTGTEVDKEPVQAGHNGDGKTVCVRQFGHIRAGVRFRIAGGSKQISLRPQPDVPGALVEAHRWSSSVKDATRWGIDAEPSLDLQIGDGGGRAMRILFFHCI
jgi:hypothetical protein